MKTNIKMTLATIALSGALMVTGMPSAEAKVYKDSGEKTYHTKEIDKITKLGVMKGYKDGEFKVYSQVNRASMTGFLWKAMEKSGAVKRKKYTVKTAKYKDVSSKTTFSPYIKKAQRAGVVTGDSKTKFNPYKKITRNEALNMVLKGFTVYNSSTSKSEPFTDVNSKTKNYSNIVKAYNAGIISADYTNKFRPNEIITRAEVASLLSKAVEYEKTRGKSVEKTVFKRANYAAVPKGIKAASSYKSIQKGLSASKTTFNFDPNELDPNKASDLIKTQFIKKTGNKYMLKSWTVYSSGKVEVSYNYTPGATQFRIKEADKKADAIIKKVIKPTYTDFEKVKALHDYLVLNTQYDYKNYLKKTVPANSYNAYGALVKNVAVCDGYTRAMILLLDKVGIENHYVTGKVKGGNHSWNMVKIDGKYYHLDATWNDPVPNQPNRVFYNYFLVNDSKMKKTHSWDKSSVPASTSTRFLLK